MTRTWKWLIAWLTAAALTAPLAAQTSSWGEGQGRAGTYTNQWIGGGGGMSWSSARPYDPNQTWAWTTGTNRVTTGSAYNFAPRTSSIAWTAGVHPLALAEGRYTWTGGDLTGRFEFFSTGPTDYCSNKVVAALGTYSGGVFTPLQSTTGQDLEVDITAEWRAAAAATSDPTNDAFTVSIQATAAWPSGGFVFDVPAGADVRAFATFHTRGNAVIGSTTIPQMLNSSNGNGIPTRLVRNNGTDFSGSPPYAEMVFEGTCTGSCFLQEASTGFALNWTVETANRVLVDVGTAGSPVLPNTATEVRVQVPEPPSGQVYYIMCEGVTVPRGVSSTVDLRGLYAWNSVDQSRVSFNPNFATTVPASGNDTLTWTPAGGGGGSVDLNQRIEAGDTFNYALRLEQSAANCKLFYCNTTTGQGPTTPRSSSATSTTSATQVIGASGTFTSANVGHTCCFWNSGGRYEITGYVSSTTVNVSGNPSAETGGFDVRNRSTSTTDLATFRWATKSTGNRGAAGAAGNGAGRTLVLQSSPAGAQINRVVVTTEPLVVVGDSNCQESVFRLGYWLPRVFTQPRYAWKAWISGSACDLDLATYDKGDFHVRHCSPTPGQGDLCEMDGAIAVFAAGGINDIRSRGESERDRTTAGVVMCGGIMARNAMRYGQDYLVITPPIYLEQGSSGYRYDAMFDMAAGLVGPARGARSAYYDGQPTLVSNPGLYMAGDGYHLTSEGAEAVSRAAAAAYESGSFSQ